MDPKKVLSLIILVIGLFMILVARQEYLVFSSEYNPLFNVSPDSEIKWLFILGIAAIVGGFTGLIREKIV